MLGIEDYGSGSDNDESPPTAISLPPPTAQPKLRRPPKKIAIRLPNIKDDEDDDLKDERPVAKKPRLQSGAGSSALLSMLPQPKQKNPLPPSSERVRVLGGGRGPGLVFNTVPQSATFSLDTYDDDRTEDQVTNGGAASDSQHATVPHPFLPPSLAKGKPSISVEADSATSRPTSQPRNAAPAIDFFSLGLFLRSTHMLLY
jgi:proline-rich protein PRCC